MRFQKFTLMLVLLCGPVSLAAFHAQQDSNPAAPPDLLLIADFDRGVQNALGGYHNRFERAPSAATTARVADIVRGESGRSLKVLVNQKGGGFGGVWMTFYNFKEKEHQYLDVQGYSHLSFWVRGEKGAEQFAVKLSDDSWVPREDSLAIGPISRFLPRGVTTEWQEVLVPLSGLKLNLKAMAGLTLDFDVPGRHAIFIDDVAFKRSAQVSTPLSPWSEKSEPKREHDRAMWDWEVLPHISAASGRKDFLEFCKREKIRTVWMQVAVENSPLQNGLLGEVKVFKGLLKNRNGFRSFISEAHHAGMRVEALDGFPEYAVKQNHNIPLAVIDAVIAYNNASRPEERFDGVHFDNEPYLLIGWRDWKIRERILLDFLELNRECQRRVREANMVYGIDIPFWWQYRDHQTGQYNGMVEFNGTRKPASFHCIDMLDNVGVMNYRNTVDGADGMLEHGTELLQYADKAKRARLFMGVETFSYPPMTVWFAAGLPRKEFEERLRSDAADLALRSRVNGFRTQIFDDGTNLNVGIELPPNPTPEQKKNINAAMLEIARRLGASAHPAMKARSTEILNYALLKVSSDPEWKTPKPRVITDPANGAKYGGFEAVSIMLPKITFAGKSRSEMQAEIRLAEEEFSRYQYYSGIALHYYDSYRAKLEEKPGQNQ